MTTFAIAKLDEQLFKEGAIEKSPILALLYCKNKYFEVHQKLFRILGAPMSFHQQTSSSIVRIFI